jgi:nicotinate-nucleotide adenylyltransferase
MRVGLFGGSFDPPHRGHLAVALAAAEAYTLDRVLLAPTGRQPLKQQGATAAFVERLAMVGLLCAGQPQLEGSAIDAPLPGGKPNFTIDTLARLRASLAASDELFVLVGADAFLDLRRWRDPEGLLAAAEWVVVSRPGLSRHDLSALALTHAQSARVHWLGGVSEPAAATGIRSSLQRGDDVSNVLPAAVLEFIRAHHLYGT